MLEEYDYNDFVYDAEKKAYINKDFKEGENEIVIKFENGQIVSLREVGALMDESIIVMEGFISDIGTTVVDAPEYTFAE